MLIRHITEESQVALKEHFQYNANIESDNKAADKQKENEHEKDGVFFYDPA